MDKETGKLIEGDILVQDRKTNLNLFLAHNLSEIIVFT